MQLSIESAIARVRKIKGISPKQARIAVSILGINSHHLKAPNVRALFSRRNEKRQVKPEFREKQQEALWDRGVLERTIFTDYQLHETAARLPPDLKAEFDKSDPREGPLSRAVMQELGQLKAQAIYPGSNPHVDLAENLATINPHLLRALFSHIPRKDAPAIGRSIRWLLNDTYNFARFELPAGSRAMRVIPTSEAAGKKKSEWEEGDYRVEGPAALPPKMVQVGTRMSRAISVASKQLGVEAGLSAALLWKKPLAEVRSIANEAAPLAHEDHVLIPPIESERLRELLVELRNIAKPQDMMAPLIEQAGENLGLSPEQTQDTLIYLHEATDHKTHPLKAAVTAQALAQHYPWKWFNAHFHVDPFDYLRYGRRKSYTMVMKPDFIDRDVIEQISHGLNFQTHHPGSVGYARFIPDGERLVVFEMQSDLKSAGLSDEYRQRFSDWKKIMLWKLKDYAREKGFKEVWVTSGHWQKERWKNQEGGGIHPATLIQTYAAPFADPKLGFQLHQAEKPVRIEGTKSDLFWVAKIPPKATPAT